VTLGVVIFVAIVAASGFLALSASGALAAHHTINGSITLIDTSNNTLFPGITAVAGGCQGSGGYSDMSPGDGVTVKDGDGKLLATTTLGSGSGTTTRCTFDFSLPNVPEAAFYTIEVGRRGGLSYPLAEMKAQDWSVELTLGS
jgi:hypothetical protein